MKGVVLVAIALAWISAGAGAAPTHDSAGFPAADRPIAPIVSPTWSTGAFRDSVGETAQVIGALGVRTGMSVADIGAGEGYYMSALSAAVGEKGRVMAQDVMPQYVTMLQSRARSFSNVSVVQGAFDDPKLPPNSLDAALMVHMYHEIQQPFGLLYRLAGAMRPGAKLGVVELDRKTALHGTPPALLKCELAAVGYAFVFQRKLHGDIGYLAVFSPPRAQDLPAPSTIRPCRAS